METDGKAAKEAVFHDAAIIADRHSPWSQKVLKARQASGNMSRIRLYPRGQRRKHRGRQHIQKTLVERHCVEHSVFHRADEHRTYGKTVSVYLRQRINARHPQRGAHVLRDAHWARLEGVRDRAFISSCLSSLIQGNVLRKTSPCHRGAQGRGDVESS